MSKIVLVCVILSAASLACQAAMITCPDPQTTSLKWGEIPGPWQVDPFSRNPQANEDTRFARANILVAGMGRGVVCTYKSSGGFYSIWRPVRVKIPAREDYNWIDTNGGFVCTDSLIGCKFSVEEG